METMTIKDYILQSGEFIVEIPITERHYLFIEALNGGFSNNGWDLSKADSCCIELLDSDSEVVKTFCFDIYDSIADLIETATKVVQG